MTRVNRTVSRLTPVIMDRREVVVSMEPPGTSIGLRLKGTRRTYYLPVSAAYVMAVRAHVDAIKEAKKKGAKP